MVPAARAALSAGRPILCDVNMVASGVTRRRLPADNQVLCLLKDPRVPELAARLGTTRTAAAVELWAEHLEGSVVAVGNAPTALFHLLKWLSDDPARPVRLLCWAFLWGLLVLLSLRRRWRRMRRRWGLNL